MKDDDHTPLDIEFWRTERTLIEDDDRMPLAYDFGEWKGPRLFGQWVPEQSRRLKKMDKKKSDLLVCGYQSRADDLKIWTRRGPTFWSVGARAEQMT